MAPETVIGTFVPGAYSLTGARTCYHRRKGDAINPIEPAGSGDGGMSAPAQNEVTIQLDPGIETIRIS